MSQLNKFEHVLETQLKNLPRPLGLSNLKWPCRRSRRPCTGCPHRVSDLPGIRHHTLKINSDAISIFSRHFTAKIGKYGTYQRRNILFLCHATYLLTTHDYGVRNFFTLELFYFKRCYMKYRRNRGAQKAPPSVFGGFGKPFFNQRQIIPTTILKCLNS